ncbi:MAG: cytidine deaminase [Gaiellales bacterium]|nr:cytidine deaminase [Gaiellales bacterium]
MEPTEQDRELYERARAAAANAHVPYSRFAVGAALLTEDGTVVTGVNVENVSYGLTSCAERNAIFTAVGSGHQRFQAIAIHGDSPSVPPCGACRQVMSEFAPALRIIRPVDGKLDATTLAELLPEQFAL